MGCFLCISFVIAVALAAFKIYYKLFSKWNRSYTCLIGKTAIVTGANTGIGYKTALDFAMRGARVILACRNKEKANEAHNKIVKATDNENIVVKIVDMQSLDSVREFAQDINATEAKIDILVNNAGVMHLANQKTKDGLQILMQVNYFGPFLLTHLLIDKLKSSAPSRIVNVSSLLAKYSTLVANKINDYPEGTGYTADHAVYANSKLGNILFTTELAKKLDGTGVTVNCLHPGVIATEITRNVPGMIKHVSEFFAQTFLLNPEEGAQTTIYAAVSKDVEGITGELFSNCEKIAMYESANDICLAKSVWTKSEELVKLRDDEKI